MTSRGPFPSNLTNFTILWFYENTEIWSGMWYTWLQVALEWSVKFLTVRCPKESFERAAGIKGCKVRVGSSNWTADYFFSLKKKKPQKLHKSEGLIEATPSLRRYPGGMQIKPGAAVSILLPWAIMEVQKVIWDMSCVAGHSRREIRRPGGPFWIQCCLCIYCEP